MYMELAIVKKYIVASLRSPSSKSVVYPLARSLRSLTDSFVFCSHRLSLILLLTFFELRHFHSVLRSSWDAQLTSRITVKQSLRHYFFHHIEAILELCMDASKRVKIIPHFHKHRSIKKITAAFFRKRES